MKSAFQRALAICCVPLLLVWGCGGDDEEGDDGGSARCQQGCVATLEADCDNGPATQAECEEDCEALLMGACGTEYEVLLTCAEGEAIGCSASGLPVIEACADEQGAFIDCLN